MRAVAAVPLLVATLLGAGCGGSAPPVAPDPNSNPLLPRTRYPSTTTASR